MNESKLSDQALAELLTLTVEVDGNGSRFYRNQQGQLHRVHGPAVMYTNGVTIWYQNGQRHRTDGPSYVGVWGKRQWYQNDKCHRTDGPAVEYADGDGNCEWWLNGQEFTEEEWNERVKTI